MGHRKPTKDALERQVVRVRGRAEAYGRTGEFGAFKRITDAFLSDPTRRDGRGISTGAIAEAHLG